MKSGTPRELHAPFETLSGLRDDFIALLIVGETLQVGDGARHLLAGVRLERSADGAPHRS